MKLWEKSIIEWINCLKVLEEPVTSTTELQNGIFYINFLNLIKWKKHKEEEANDQGNLIIKFLEDQYPSFKVNKDDSTEHIYVASVLLMHLCRKQSAIHHSLQYNMCDKLAEETQLRVKVFLENVLPLGKDVTKETIKEVIMEVENLSLSVCKKSPFEGLSVPAPSTGKSKRLLTERLRELREVRCNLALERFTNAELQNDIAKQQDKIKSLQKKLDEKTEQLKTLREEWMRPSTPQSSHGTRDFLEEELQYRSKYIKDLESQLNKQQDEIDKLETEKDTLVEQLSCAQKSSVHYKESFVNCERSLETLSEKIESKDRELVALRIHNEELRAHIKGLTRDPTEQSFEGDDASLSNTMSMNTSEVLSTVIEIQLQEAREESAVLHAQVDKLKDQLNLLTKNYRTALDSNRNLQNELKALAQTQTELEAARKELEASNTNVAKLRTERESLVVETDNLKSSLLRKENELSDTERLNIALNEKLDIAQKELAASNTNIAKLQTEKESLVAETENLKNLLLRKENELSDTKQSNVALNEELDIAREELEASNTNIAKLQTEKESLVAETENLKSSLLRKENELSDTKRSNVALNEELDIAREELEASNTNIAKLQAEKESLVEETENLKSSLLRKENELSDTKRSNVALNEELDIAREELEASNTNIAKLYAEKESLVAETENLKSSLSRKENELSDTKRSNVALNEELDIAREELEASNTNIAKLQAEKESLVEETENLKSSLSRKEEELSDMERSNVALNEELETAREELEASNTNIAKLQAEKESLVAETENLKSSLLRKEEELSDTKRSNIALNEELDALKADVKDLSELLADEKTNSANLSTALTQTRSEVTEHLARIQKLNADGDSYRSSIEVCSSCLTDILLCTDFAPREFDGNNSGDLTLDDLITYVRSTLRNADAECSAYKCEVEELSRALDETSADLSGQRLTVAHLQEQNRENLGKLAALEEEKRQTELLSNQQKEIIDKYSEELVAFEHVRDEKRSLERNVCELQQDLIYKEESLRFCKILVEDLRKDFNLMKEETQRSVASYRDASGLTVEKLQRSYQALLRNFDEAQRQKEELECNLNRNKEELSSAEAAIFVLHETSVENEKVLNTLKEERRTLCGELSEAKRVVENLKQALTIMKTGANSNLENLKSENRNLSLELKIATDKVDLLQREIGDVRAQVESKEEEITELLMSVSSLKGEKQHLMRLHGEIIDTKNTELRIKEDALLMLQSKVEELASEASDKESKMQEVIVSLQEVRASQDAVLATQEAALKEKCLRMEELQERFDNSKKLLNDELEDTRSLVNEYQVKLSHLENQINNQNRTLVESQEMLNELNAELEASNERCKLMDASQAEIVKLCEELEYPTKNLSTVILQVCSDFDFLCQDSRDESRHECAHQDSKTADISSVIKMTLDELHKSQKVILGLSRMNAELNETLAEQNLRLENNAKDKEEVYSLRNRIQELEVIAQKRNDYLKNLIKNKESLKDSLQRLFVSQRDSGAVLTSLTQKWRDILTRFQDVLRAESSVCDEVKQLHARKASLENTLSKYQADHLENIRAISQILWEKFLWTEQTLLDTYLCSAHERECLDILTRSEENEFFQEKMAIDAKVEEHRTLQADVTRSEREMESFSTLAAAYESGLKSGEIKSYAEKEKSLQSQIGQLTKDRKDLKDRMDTMRARNVKLEKNIDDLRAEIRKLKATEVAQTEADSTEVKSLKEETERLKEQNQRLREEKEEAAKVSKQDFENQLKDIHTTYEKKLDDMKQQMKAVYNEQMMKKNKEQEKIIQREVEERVQSQMKVLCQKHAEELCRYKAHVTELSSQLWSVGEKLLIVQQENEALKRIIAERSQFTEIEADQPITISRKTCKVEKQEMLSENAQQTEKKVTTLTTTEETLERRHSIRNIQAMGNAFKTEDEEEVFDNIYLADMKRGNCLPATDIDRLSILQMRNSLCLPHLKSSYPAEMQFISSTLTEEEIKTGSQEENFNDSLSQSLLPEQKAKKRDRTQTSYKRPGPPTPSKNGGRLSLQSNELRSPCSRVLRERNVDRKTTTTPHSLKNLFSLKRQDENVSTTPKGRRLSNLFRKPKVIRSMNE